MCDPATIISAVLLGGASVGSALMQAKPADPPPLPAPKPDGARPAGATVRIGDGQDKGTNDETNAPKQRVATTETRSFGRPVGGNLGRSGLAI